MIKVLSGLLPILCYNGCIIAAFFSGEMPMGTYVFLGLILVAVLYGCFNGGDFNDL